MDAQEKICNSVKSSFRHPWGKCLNFKDTFKDFSSAEKKKNPKFPQKKKKKEGKKFPLGHTFQ